MSRIIEKKYRRLVIQALASRTDGVDVREEPRQNRGQRRSIITTLVAASFVHFEEMNYADFLEEKLKTSRRLIVRFEISHYGVEDSVLITIRGEACIRELNIVNKRVYFRVEEFPPDLLHQSAQ